MNWYLAPVIIDEVYGYTQVASQGGAHFPPASKAHVGRATDNPVPTECLIKTATPAPDWSLVAPEDFDAVFTSLFGRVPLDVEK